MLKQRGSPCVRWTDLLSRGRNFSYMMKWIGRVGDGWSAKRNQCLSLTLPLLILKQSFFQNDLFIATLRVLIGDPTKTRGHLFQHPDVLGLKLHVFIKGTELRSTCGISDHCPPKAKRKVVCRSGIHGCWLKWRNMDRRRYQGICPMYYLGL